jgi:predicted RNase H-like HicB family nuclease
MRDVEYTCWRDGDTFLGFLNDHPDYWTQGDTKPELIENLKGLWEDVMGIDRDDGERMGR